MSDPDPETSDDRTAVAEHAIDSIRAVHEFEEASAEDVSRMQSAVEWWSTYFGSVAYFLWIIAFVAIWIGYSLVARHLGWKFHDDPPFSWLQGLVSFDSLVLTVAVLIRQNRMSDISKHRAHLDLQINLLTEKKVSLLLQRFEELHPSQPDADGDPTQEREVLAQPTDPVAMLHVIKKTSDGAADGK